MSNTSTSILVNIKSQVVNGRATTSQRQNARLVREQDTEAQERWDKKQQEDKDKKS
jgi:hypothetical protein